MHAVNELVPTLVQLQNTVGWIVLVLLVVAALLGVWYLAGRLLGPSGDEMSEDWQVSWTREQRALADEAARERTARRRR